MVEQILRAFIYTIKALYLRLRAAIVNSFFLIRLTFQVVRNMSLVI